MIQINLLTEDPAYRVRDCLVLSRPVRLRQGLSWLRLEVRSGSSAEMIRMTAVRKVHPFVYHRTPRAPWEDK